MYPAALSEPSILTVSELNAQIRTVLESGFRYVWVKGEISNFRMPASGHSYFTLKDAKSQIRAVFFRLQRRNIRFDLEDGLQVICQGRVGVYEPRGEYQLIIEIMEPQGIGALQLAFEQLKKKLDGEGLFDADRKLPLPAYPRSIAIVTSSTGAAIRDILKVLQRCPHPLSVTVLPVRVQGQEAAGEIASAIASVNATQEIFGWDLIITGRGGGSIEDLWPFNEEVVARAVAASEIPIISAVGHEIDFTICDLVADMRAPTPTAAAEWVVAQHERLQRELQTFFERLHRNMLQRIESYRQKLQYLEKRLVDPQRRLQDLRLLIDDRLGRIQLAFLRRMEKLRTHHGHLCGRLKLCHPAKSILQSRALLGQKCRELCLHHHKVLDMHRFRLQKYALQLGSLSPLACLARGYSITYRMADGKLVRSSKEVQAGEDVRIRLAEGALECTIRKTEAGEESSADNPPL